MNLISSQATVHTRKDTHPECIIFRREPTQPHEQEMARPVQGLNEQLHAAVEEAGHQQ